MMAMMLLSATSKGGVGVNVRLAGDGTILFQSQLINNNHLADLNVSTHGGEVVSKEGWDYAH